jgi:hypothetical protein
MRGFILVKRNEEKPVRARSQDCGHLAVFLVLDAIMMNCAALPFISSDGTFFLHAASDSDLTYFTTLSKPCRAIPKTQPSNSEQYESPGNLITYSGCYPRRRVR